MPYSARLSRRIALLNLLIRPGASEDITQRDDHRNPKRNPWFFIFLLGTLLSGLAIFMANEDFLPEEGGKAVLAPWRKAKMERELEEMEEGEQYVLVVAKPGNFPCFSCLGKKEIYLNLDEVWKYGVTSKGQQGRYTSGLPDSGLVYVAEFIGELRECYRQEKIKIYNYALLPENLRRTERLIRPPGNKQDN